METTIISSLLLQAPHKFSIVLFGPRPNSNCYIGLVFYISLINNNLGLFIVHSQFGKIKKSWVSYENKMVYYKLKSVFLWVTQFRPQPTQMVEILIYPVDDHAICSSTNQ